MSIPPLALASPYSCVSSVHLSSDYLNPAFVTKLRSSPFNSALTEFPYPMHRQAHQANPVIPQLAVDSSSELIAALTTDRLINLYSATPTGLRFAHSLRGHTAPIHDMKFQYSHPAHAVYTQPFPYLLLSCDARGFVHYWDTRTAKNFQKFQLPRNSESFAVQLIGHSLLVGSEGKIFLFDARKMGLMHEYEEFLTGSVLELAVNPLSQSIFSCGSDNVVNEFSIAGGRSSDSADSHLMTFVCDSEIDRIGFFGPEFGSLYCISSTEGFSAFDIASGESICDKPDIRSELAKISGIHMDYLLECNSTSNALVLAAGNNNGSIALFNINLSNNQSSQSQNQNQNPPDDAYSMEKPSSLCRLDLVSVVESSSRVDYFHVDDKDVNVSIAAEQNESEEFAMDTGNDEKTADNEGEIIQAIPSNANTDLMNPLFSSASLNVSELVESEIPDFPGHSACIRSLVYCSALPVFLTGGQDGKLCQWANSSAIIEAAKKYEEGEKARKSIENQTKAAGNSSNYQKQIHTSTSKSISASGGIGNRKNETNQNKQTKNKQFRPY